MELVAGPRQRRTAPARMTPSNTSTGGDSDMVRRPAEWHPCSPRRVLTERRAGETGLRDCEVGGIHFEVDPVNFRLARGCSSRIREKCNLPGVSAKFPDCTPTIARLIDCLDRA